MAGGALAATVVRSHQKTRIHAVKKRNLLGDRLDLESEVINSSKSVSEVTIFWFLQKKSAAPATDLFHIAN